MVKYLLTKFHGHDEEIETLHLPVAFVAILSSLAVRFVCIAHHLEFTLMLV